MNKWKQRRLSRQWTTGNSVLVANQQRETTQRQSLLVAEYGCPRKALDSLKPRPNAKPRSKPFCSGLFVMRKRRTVKQARIYWQLRGDYWFSNLSLSDGNYVNLPSWGFGHTTVAGWHIHKDYFPAFAESNPDLVSDF